MAKIAILGSSFSVTLYRHKHENEIQKKPWNKRPRLKSTATSLEYDDNKNHWVALLAKKYPQHKFYIFAKGGTGWEYAQQMLHMLSELKRCDRVIVELCDYRALVLSQDIAFNKLKKAGRHLIYIPPARSSYQTMIDHIKESIAVNAQHEIDDDKIILHNIETPYVFSTDVLEYMVRSVMSPVYTTRYRNYLSSLINVWPHIFDKVGVWAYEPFDIPHPVNFNANKEYFNNRMQYFEETMIEKWLREDPINNSIDSWKDKHYGFDGRHLNKESMPLLVDFLLKQSSIQQVLDS